VVVKQLFNSGLGVLVVFLYKKAPGMFAEASYNVDLQ